MPDNTIPRYCQGCAKVKVCKQINDESGFWPEGQDCFIPDCVKQYPIDYCRTCSAIHNCIARHNADPANWKCGGNCNG